MAASSHSFRSIILGSSLLTATGDGLYINGALVSGAGGSGVSYDDTYTVKTTGAQNLNGVKSFLDDVYLTGNGGSQGAPSIILTADGNNGLFHVPNSPYVSGNELLLNIQDGLGGVNSISFKSDGSSSFQGTSIGGLASSLILSNGYANFSSLTYGLSPFVVYESGDGLIPKITFSQTGTSKAAISRAADSSDPDHTFFIFGENIQASATLGTIPIISNQFGWGIGVERNYNNGETIQHEAYFETNASDRPLFIGYSQRTKATISSMITGLIGITSPETTNFLKPNIRFKFSGVASPSGFTNNTFYKIKDVTSSTGFSFMPTTGGAAISASGGIGGYVVRGGWGNGGYTVPVSITCSEYDSNDIKAGCALQIVNNASGYGTYLSLDNYDPGGSLHTFIDYGGLWRMGSDHNGAGTDNFYLKSLTNGNYILQISSGNQIAMGFDGTRTNVAKVDVSELYCLGNITGNIISTSGVSIINSSAMTAPSNTGTPARWLNLTVTGVVYKVPLYL